MKEPPTLSVPAPEKVIWEAVPAEVILPVTVMVPVETVTIEVRVPVVPDRVREAQDKLPAFTSILLKLLFPGR